MEVVWVNRLPMGLRYEGVGVGSLSSTESIWISKRYDLLLGRLLYPVRTVVTVPLPSPRNDCYSPEFFVRGGDESLWFVIHLHLPFLLPVVVPFKTVFTGTGPSKKQGYSDSPGIGGGGFLWCTNSLTVPPRSVLYVRRIFFEIKWRPGLL